MSDLLSRTILLLPAPDRRDRLLGPSPFGVEIPTATHGDHGTLDRRCTEWWGIFGGECSCGTRALPLVWEGAIVPEACDRAIRVLAAVAMTPALRHTYTHADAEDLARKCERFGIGTIIRPTVERPDV